MKKQTYKKMFNVAMTATLATGTLVAVAPSQTDAATVSFKDLKANNAHYNDIIELANRGVVGGYTDGTYRPSKSVSRGEAAKIIAGVLDLNTTAVKNPNFKDIDTTNVYYNSIAALVEAGVINGFEDNTYRPNDTLTRGQMAKIIAFGFDLQASSDQNPFRDIDQSIYKESIIALFDNNVTTGKTATTYGASDQVTRAQLASFVIRAENATSKTTPSPGVTTIEGVYTIGSVVGNTVTIAGEQFAVSPELTKVFNVDNAAALADSVVTLEIEYTTEPVASTTPMFAQATGKIVGINTLKLVKDNTNFNANGYTLPKIEVAATGVSLTNVNATSLEVAAGKVVTLVNSNITNLVVADKAAVTLTNSAITTVEIKGASKITIGAGTTLGTIVLEKGKTLADVIANYAEVKDQLTGVTIVEVPVVTPSPAPSTPSPSTPIVTEEQKQTFLTQVTTNLNALSNKPGLKTVEVTTNASEVTFTTTPDVKVFELYGVAIDFLESLQGTGTTAVVSTVTVNGNPYAYNKDSLITNYKVIASDLLRSMGVQPVDVNAIGELTSSESIWNVLTNSPYTTSIYVTFNDGSSHAVTINLKKGQ